jgi:DNA-binding NtrC family response regulator
LIVPLVNRFDDDQQRQLLRWIEETGGKVRVIATTPGSLFGLVERGLFLDALYYRLNTVRLEVDYGGADTPRGQPVASDGRG